MYIRNNMNMLEELDRKIISALDEDSSKSLTRISQEIGSTPQLVKYHLEKLQKEGVIVAYWPMIDFRKLGYSNVSYFLKLKNLTPKTERDIFTFLSKGNEFNIVMRGDGYWDLHFTISTQSLFRSIEAFNGFYDRFHHFILHADMALSAGFYQFRRTYLKIGLRRTQGFMALTGADVQKVTLSADTLQVLEAFNENSRQSYAELANRLGMSRDKVKYHLEKLKTEGIVQSQALLLDNDRIGYSRYRIVLQVTNFTSKEFDDFFRFCQAHPNIIHLLRLFGNWQALIDVEIESRKKLRLLLREILHRFGNIVLRLEPTHVYKVDKFRDIPLKIV